MKKNQLQLKDGQTAGRDPGFFESTIKAKTILIFGLMLFTVLSLQAATYYSVATGNWAASATWSTTSGGAPGTVAVPSTGPVTGDVVYIENGFTVTVGSAAVCTSLNIAGGSTLTVSADITVSGATSISGSLTLNQNYGTKIFTGLVTINSSGNWNNSIGCPVTFRGGIANNGIFTAGSPSNYIFDTNAQSLNGIINMTGAPVNVTGINLTNNGTLTLTKDLTGTGTLTNSSTGTLNIGGGTYTSINTLTNQGTLNLTSTGGVGTTTANFTNTGIINLNGSAFITGITNNAGGTVNFINSAQTIGAFNNATSSSTLNISALTSVINTLTATASGNTVNYNGAGDQTIKDNVSFSNLSTSGSGSKNWNFWSNVTISNLTVGVGTNFTTSGSSGIQVTGTTDVTGTLTLGSTGQKTFNDININSGGVWNETGVASYTITGNLTFNGTAFTALAGVHTFSGTGKSINGLPISIPNITISGTYTCNANLTAGNNLTINSDKKLSIGAAKQLTTTVAFANSGTLELLSDASGTATILTPATINPSGSTIVNQYLNAYRGWYMTSPVVTNTPVPNAGALSIYSYLESAIDDQTTGLSWILSTTMAPNKGYSVSPSGAGTTNIAFTGALNNGNMSYPITYNNNVGKSKNGYNLIGNPYPSYLTWTALFTANSSKLSTATMWYRTKVGATYYFWTVNSSGIGSPVDASNRIPPMQAFWVRTATASTTIDMTNAMRTHAPSTYYLLKAPAAKNVDNQILRLQITNGITTDEAVLYFNENAVNEFDAYDSPKMINGSTSTVPDIYTIVGGEELVINGMNTIPYDTEIPVYFNANASTGTSYTFATNEFSNFEAGTQVWIKNNQSGMSQLISDGSTYTFDVSETGTNPKFSIIIKVPGAATQLANAKNNNMFAYLNANNQITVSCSDALSSDANVSVYNSLGQRIVRKPLTKSVTRIDNQLTAGVYLVTVFNAGNKTTEKIIIR